MPMAMATLSDSKFRISILMFSSASPVALSESPCPSFPSKIAYLSLLTVSCRKWLESSVVAYTLQPCFLTVFISSSSSPSITGMWKMAPWDDWMVL